MVTFLPHKRETQNQLYDLYLTHAVPPVGAVIHTCRLRGLAAGSDQNTKVSFVEPEFG